MALYLEYCFYSTYLTLDEQGPYQVISCWRKTIFSAPIARTPPGDSNLSHQTI